MQDCIFCNIVNGEISSFKVYEDGEYLAFLDAFPRVIGHTLVVPKKHYRWVYDVPSFGEYFEVARKVGLALQKILDAEFFSIVTMGEAVHHAHIHLLPQDDDSVHGVNFTSTIEITSEEKTELSQKVRNTLEK